MTQGCDPKSSTPSPALTATSQSPACRSCSNIFLYLFDPPPSPPPFLPRSSAPLILLRKSEKPREEEEEDRERGGGGGGRGWITEGIRLIKSTAASGRRAAEFAAIKWPDCFFLSHSATWETARGRRRRRVPRCETATLKRRNSSLLVQHSSKFSQAKYCRQKRSIHK